MPTLTRRERQERSHGIHRGEKWWTRTWDHDGRCADQPHASEKAAREYARRKDERPAMDARMIEVIEPMPPLPEPEELEAAMEIAAYEGPLKREP
jgi:hypothetical protein